MTTTCASAGDSESSHSHHSPQSTSATFCSDEHHKENDTGASTTSTSTGNSTTTETSHTETEHHTQNQTSVTAHWRTNETSTTAEGGQFQSREYQFHLVSAATNRSGFGEVGVDSDELIIDVQAHVGRLEASTEYTLEISMNGTSHAVGTLVTDGLFLLYATLAVIFY